MGSMELAYPTRRIGGTCRRHQDTLTEETETDLPGERLSCVHVSHSDPGRSDLLVEAGHQPEIAYFEVQALMKQTFLYQRG